MPIHPLGIVIANKQTADVYSNFIQSEMMDWSS